jgi:cytochrome c1
MAGRSVALVALMVALAGCGARSDEVAEGRRVMLDKGCTGCHVIPGVPGPFGSTGPSLAGFAARPTIAGVVPNTPDNLAIWLNDPARLKPGTLMPAQRLTPAQTNAAVAFLGTLREPNP